MGTLMGGRHWYEEGWFMHIYIGLMGEGQIDAGDPQIAQPLGGQDRFGPGQGCGEKGEALSELIIIGRDGLKDISGFRHNDHPALVLRQVRAQISGQIGQMAAESAQLLHASGFDVQPKGVREGETVIIEAPAHIELGEQGADQQECTGEEAQGPSPFFPAEQHDKPDEQDQPAAYESVKQKFSHGEGENPQELGGEQAHGGIEDLTVDLLHPLGMGAGPLGRQQGKAEQQGREAQQEKDGEISALLVHGGPPVWVVSFHYYSTGCAGMV